MQTVVGYGVFDLAFWRGVKGASETKISATLMVQPRHSLVLFGTVIRSQITRSYSPLTRDYQSLYGLTLHCSSRRLCHTLKLALSIAGQPPVTASMGGGCDYPSKDLPLRSGGDRDGNLQSTAVIPDTNLWGLVDMGR